MMKIKDTVRNEKQNGKGNATPKKRDSLFDIANLEDRLTGKADCISRPAFLVGSIQHEARMKGVARTDAE